MHKYSNRVEAINLKCSILLYAEEKKILNIFKWTVCLGNL